MSTGLVSSRGSSSASETASPASVPLPSLQQITSEGRVAASTRDHVEAEVQHHQPASTSSLTPPPPPPPHFIASTAATEARRHGASIDASGKPRVKKTAALPTSRARTSALAARTIRTAKATRSTAHAALCVVPHRASASASASAAAASAPQPPSSPPPSTPSAGPGTSLVEVVLDEQLCAPGPLTSSSMLPTSMHPADPLLGEMDSRTETPMPISTDVTKPRVRAGRTAAPPHPLQRTVERPSTGRAAARTSTPSNDTKVSPAHVAFDVAEDASLAASEDVEAASLWDLHASLRLQPFPPTVAASTHIASAMANVLGRSGVDSEGPALLWEPAHRGRTAAQEALAAERATLLPDGSESDPLEEDALLTRGAQQQQQRIRKKHMDGIASDERKLWRSSTSPQAGSRAALLTHAVTPADIAEFLAAEADAEAAITTATTATVAERRSEREQRGSSTRSRPFTVGAIGDSGGASASLGSPSLGQPPSPARVSPTLSQLSTPAKQNSTTTTTTAATTTNKSDPLVQSESASVLRELEAIQQRLHQRGYRHTPSAQQQEQQPHAQAQQQYQRQPCEESQRLGYASSPCDISASPSSSSSASTTSADTMSRHQAPSNLIDWTAASITDIVDALDRGTSALRHDTRHRRHNLQHKRDTHRPKDFNPALYAQALLEGNVNNDDEEEEEVEYDDEAWSNSHEALPGKDNEDASIEGADHHVKRTRSPLSSKPGKQTQLSSTGSPSAQELRRASVQRASPSWAGAAAEIGLTPAEVRELLRYSANASEAKRWLSSGGHGSGDVEEAPHPGASAQPSPHAAPHAHRSSSRGCRHVDQEAKNTFRSRESNEQQQQRKEKRIVSYVLDAATQTALVHRIVSALPTVPDGLTVEMARQRKLLERVCREVSVAAAPVHAALMERATSPTAAASMARQPPPIAFDTTQNNNNNNNNARSDLPMAAQLHESYEMQQLRASLPRPAVQTLAAAAGLHRAAADPSRPLPAFHDVVIRPPVSSPPWHRHSAGGVGGDAVGDGTRRGEQPYEAALHELAERETRHYVNELDRLRSVYDRQLADERRQRGQERQQYSALLQVQQQKMLQHHRETIHLLQREARLQAGQQDALVQQLAAAQAAATQRQQHEHARTTRQMLSGAVEAMKAQRVSAAQMDAVAGRTEQQQQQQRPGSRGIPAAAKLERLKRIRTRSANAALSATTTTTTTATPSPQPDAVATNKTRPGGHHASSPSSPPPTAGEEKERDEVTATPPTATRTKQPRTRQAAVRICAPGDAAAQDKREEDKRDVSFRESDGPDGEPSHFDADIPTAGHLTPLQQQKPEQQQTRMANGQAPASPGRVGAQNHDEDEREQSVATSDGGSSAPLLPVGAKSKNEKHEDTQNLTQTNILLRSATPAPAATAAGADALPSTVTGTRSPPPASAPTLRLNTSSTLRSVYGPSHARHRRDEEKEKEKWGDAPTAFTQAEKRILSHASPSNARMTLPLRVHLPPEDELDAHHRRVAAASTALDTRAAAAAETAGLADGTKLYVAAPRPRRAKEKFHATATRTATSPATFTADVTASKHQQQQQQQQHQRRSRTLSSRGGGGGGVLRRRGRGGQPRRSASAVTRGPRFDFEAVSTLSNESEVSPYPYDPQQQQQQEQQRFLEQHAHSGYPYSSAAQPQGFSDTRPARTLLLPHTISHFRGVWSEQLATVDGPHIDALWRTSSPAPRDVGQIAGKPSVGQPVLLISGPAATSDESPSTAAVAAAAISTQGLNAQLHHAERARARRVAELREAAERIASQQRPSTSPAPTAPASEHAAAPGVSTTTIPDAASSVIEHPQHVGALPPCDSGFFGAPGGIALFQDASDSPHNPPTTMTTDAPHPLEQDGRASGTGDGHEAIHDDLRLASHAEPLHHTGYKGVGGESARGAAMRTTTDYARAWHRYESAADAVEHAAHALAAEDAGVLEAAAQEHHRRGGPPPPPPLPPSAVSLPRLASAAAGVRYREQQLQRWSGENSVAAGNEEAPALRDEDNDNSGGGGGGGGMYVSARMAAEARALTAARQRLAQIRACFVSPPSFTYPELSASPPTTAATSSATVVAPSGEMGSAAHVRAAAVRRLVDETVVSLLESESVNGQDPVRCVVSAIEHELLRMVLEEQLTDQSPPAPAAATSGHEMTSPASTLTTIDPALVRAVVEAAIEDVVQSFVVKQQAGKESDTTDDQHQEQEHQQHEHERGRAILARAVRRYAEENSQVPPAGAPSSTPLLLRETDRERVQLPVTAANAWLHDVDESSATDAAALQPPPEETARAESGSGHGALVVAAAPAIPHTSSFSSSSPTALPMTMSVAGPSERGPAPPHDIRIVLDLSPEARQLLSPYDPSAAPAIANPARSGAAPLLSSVPHQWGTALARPPMQQEQLPGKWMELEDRRDVVVEADVRTAMTSQKQEAEQRADAGVRTCASVLTPPTPLSSGNSSRPLRERTSENAHTAAGKLEGELEEREEESTAASVTTSSSPPHLSVPSLPPPPPPPPRTAAAVAPSTETLRDVSPSLSTPVVPTTATAVPAHMSTLLPTPSEVDERSSPAASTPAPPRSSPTDSTAVVFHVLTTNLLENERVQRAGLHDREEEQRQSLLNLHLIVAHRHPPPPPQQNTWEARPISETPAVASASSAAQDAPQPVSTVFEMKPQEPQALSHPPSSAPALSSPSPRPLPPVRDAVMRAVLEWVYQFHAPHNAPSTQPTRRVADEQRTFSGPHSVAPGLVTGLHAAAEAAAMTQYTDARAHHHRALVPAGGDKEAWGKSSAEDSPAGMQIEGNGVFEGQPKLRDAAAAAAASPSQPSTRNLGSAPATSAASTSTSSTSSLLSAPSLPSSFRTDSSSSLTETKTWEKRIQRASFEPRVSARTRPVVDVQESRQPHRTRLIGTSHASSSATTRYTTTASTTSSMPCSEDQKTRQKERRRGGDDEDSETGKQRDDAREYATKDAPPMLSTVLPQRVSAEVAAALKAALRVHQREAAAASEEDQHNLERQQEQQQQQPVTSLWSNENSVAQTSAAWPESSSYAVTLPARSADTTLLHNSAPVRAEGCGRSVRRRKPISPHPRGKDTTSCANVVDVPPPPTRAAASNVWDGYSLTSTSTSSHGDIGRAADESRREGQAGHSPRRDQQLSHRATTSALPFLA